MNKIQIPNCFKELWQPAPYKVYASGRGAGKSWAFARVLLLQSLQKKMLILGAREVQNSIKDSVHRLLARQIEDLGLNNFFWIGRETIKAKYTGSEFIFKGLRDIRAAESIKSLEGINICWVEEAQSIKKDSLDLLLPTIREKDAEVWFSLNPRRPDDPVYKMFFAEPEQIPPSWIVKRVTWRDNPFFPATLFDQMEADKKLSVHKYNHVWEGAVTGGYGDIVKREWWHRWTEKEQYILKFFSIDGAFSQSKNASYSVIQLWGITNDKLDLLDSIRGRWAFPELLKNFRIFYEKHDASTQRIPFGEIVIESKASGLSLLPALFDEGYEVKPFTPKGDKVQRLHSATPYIYQGLVRIPPDDAAPWVEDFILETVSFKSDLSHNYDDQVDAMTQAVVVWRATMEEM